MKSMRRGAPAAPALFSLSPEEMVSLPLDVLARSVAVDLTRSGHATASVQNWMRRIRRAYRAHPQAMKVISEAVAWLRHHMVLVDDLSVSAEGDWTMLSRRGARWLRDGTLHPDPAG
ncbi:hypothetical protein ACGFT2_24015 [Streptomyces sp. NPDC048514]|uniref:hypothetical protein n=1 Tax=Streptomyces sp. NPDC048514 TaxID=3365564 RepID=UPI00371AA440